MPREVNLYTDAELYDAENTIVDELATLLPIAEQTGGPILDLACGTGRTTLPLAEAGFEVVGVDLSEPMLALAREKARDGGLNVAFHQQDCRYLDLPTTAARMVSMTGNAFQEFLTNEAQDDLLRSVGRHLTPGGVFVFDTRFPSVANLDRGEGEQPWSTVTDATGRTITISVIWSYDRVAHVQDYEFIERIGDGMQVAEERRSFGRLRYTWPLEMERLLAMHSFDLERVHGGWDASPLAADSREMVVVARKRG